MGLDGTGASPRLGSQATALAKLLVARFEADRFGQDLRLGAVGVFPGRLPVGLRQAWPGVLAPEDKVSLYLGGMQDEHGIVQCCVRVSVCYGAGVWQEPGGCQEQPCLDWANFKRSRRY